VHDILETLAQPVDTNSTQQRLFCLGPWRWRSQNVADELRVVGGETF
jgi:hypothetical protein